MTDKSLEQGIEIWRDISETLNGIVKDTGEININNETIWQGYLHVWNNQDWVKVLLAIELLYEDHPEFFVGNNEDAFITAKEILIKNNNNIDRVMDRKVNKRHAWRIIMSMRELWNRANDLHVPMGSPTKRTRKGNEFSKIFDNA
jgi:hypothetical protein